jgi:hypothetical protein
MEKTCRVCEEVKVLSDFPRRKSAPDGHRNECKACSNARSRKYHEMRAERQTDEQKEAQRAKWREKHERHRESAAITKRAYYAKNAQHLKAYSKEYYQRPGVKERLNEQRRLRRATDPIYRLSDTVRSSIKYGLRFHGGAKRSRKTWDALPYTPEELKQHLESQFEPWMSWDNYGEWQIDHIYPTSKLPFDSLDHPNFLKCWSLSNLRPLRASENQSKRDRVITID